MIDPMPYNDGYLGQVQEEISEMPPLSTTITKVMEICNQSDTSPHDLNRVISLDPVITGKVLKLINSTYYSLTKKVNSLTRAIIMLGINTVVNLATSTEIIKNLRVKESFGFFTIDDFWTHSICVGVTSKILAIKIGVPSTHQEEYFVAGLLHDLGKIPLNRCFSDTYSSVLTLAQDRHIPLTRAENAMFRLDHCIVGHFIAENWQLGQVLNDTLQYHHDPEKAMNENRQIVRLVALSNIFANTLKIGISGDPFPIKKMAVNLMKQFDLSWSDISDLHDEILEEIEKAKIFLQISTNGCSNEN